jgi:hypothetical protein
MPRAKSQFAALKAGFLLGRYHPSSHALDASRNPTNQALFRASRPTDPGARWPQHRLFFAKKNEDLFSALSGGTATVGGGTAWRWSRPDAFATVDVLFVDEAAQMSLANVLAVSQAANAVVLVGDPQQLDQPIREPSRRHRCLRARSHSRR